MSSKRLETAKKFIDLFTTLDGEALSLILADNYTHDFAPASLNPPAPKNKQAMLDHWVKLKEILTGFPVAIKEYVESESSNAVTVWATSQTKFREEAKDDGVAAEEWDYRGEYIFVFYMDETGGKVVRVMEFLDSKATDDKLRPLVKRARGNLNPEEGKAFF
ncbi:MAG: hypothetical protein M1820_002270 [Bogoriella megaspora]|nr:MAG: hypothetical protein M1820_002270 [Bogoriella megaspora]